jgi:prepilin-type N-terminal cleavage/methylation domain-containing protein
MARLRPRGFTLVELLVTIAIIGILVALILPAVQAARESGRQNQCKNNLKQLGLAMEGHIVAHGKYPSNGWGYLWIGDSDRGTNPKQPGGWIYNVLPYIEQKALRDVGQGMEPVDKRQVLPSLMQTPLSIFTCPTRNGIRLLPSRPTVAPHNAEWTSQVGKSDYAVNEGDRFVRLVEGPATLEEGDFLAYPWPDTTRATGICYLRSATRPADVSDGLSQTYLIGEKFVSSLYVDTWDDLGHDQSMYSGRCVDISRWVMGSPLRDCDETYFPPHG